MLKNNQLVIYDKTNLKIISMLSQEFPPIEADVFFQEFCENYANDYNVDDLAFLILEKQKYDDYLSDIHYKTLLIDPIKKYVSVDYKINPIHNTTYNLQTFKRTYSVDDVRKMYNEHYVNFNLKNFLLSKNFKYSWRYLDEINIRTQSFNKNWNYFHSDPFLRDAHENKLQLGRNILKNGTYWPVVVAPIDASKPDKLYAFEGGHRITSLKLLQLEDEVPENFKIFCLEFPDNYKDIVTEQLYLPLKTPFKIRGSLETFYGCDILVDNEKLNGVIKTIQKTSDKLVDDYTLETTAENIDLMLSGTQVYPHFLRDLIYNMQDQIIPNPIINNEKIFTDWINN